MTGQTRARRRQVLGALMLAARQAPDADWARLTRHAEQVGTRFRPPVTRAEITEVHGLRIADLFDPDVPPSRPGVLPAAELAAAVLAVAPPARQPVTTRAARAYAEALLAAVRARREARL